MTKNHPIDPYDECAKCGKFHYSHEAQWLNPKEKHPFVPKKVVPKKEAMKIYYVYDSDIDTDLGGDPIVSLHLTLEGAEAEIKKLYAERKTKRTIDECYQCHFMEVKQ